MVPPRLLHSGVRGIRPSRDPPLPAFCLRDGPRSGTRNAATATAGSAELSRSLESQPRPCSWNLEPRIGKRRSCVTATFHAMVQSQITRCTQVTDLQLQVPPTGEIIRARACDRDAGRLSTHGEGSSRPGAGQGAAGIVGVMPRPLPNRGTRDAAAWYEHTMITRCAWRRRRVSVP